MRITLATVRDVEWMEQSAPSTAEPTDIVGTWTLASADGRTWSAAFEHDPAAVVLAGEPDRHPVANGEILFGMANAGSCNQEAVVIVQRGARRERFAGLSTWFVTGVAGNRVWGLTTYNVCECGPEIFALTSTTNGGASFTSVEVAHSAWAWPESFTLDSSGRGALVLRQYDNQNGGPEELRTFRTTNGGLAWTEGRRVPAPP